MRRRSILANANFKYTHTPFEYTLNILFVDGAADDDDDNNRIAMWWSKMHSEFTFER